MAAPTLVCTERVAVDLGQASATEAGRRSLACLITPPSQGGPCRQSRAFLNGKIRLMLECVA